MHETKRPSRKLTAFVYQESLPGMRALLHDLRRAYPKYEWLAEHRPFAQICRLLAEDFRQPWTSTLLFPMSYRVLPRLAREGYLTPLDGAFSSRACAAFSPQALNLATPGRQLVAIPEDLSPYALIARRDLLDRLDLRPPKTWTELERQLPLLSKLCGGRPVCVELSKKGWDQGIGLLSSLLSSHGVPLDSLSAGLAAGTRAWKDVFEFARGVQKHFDWLNTQTDTLDDFLRGPAAYCFAFPGRLARLPFEQLEKLLIAPVPLGIPGSRRTVFCKGTCWCVPRGALAPDLAITLLKALAEPARVKAMELAHGCAFPAQHGLWRDAEVLARKPVYAQAAALLDATECRPMPADIEWDLAWNSFYEAITRGESADTWLERVKTVCGSLARTEVRHSRIRGAIRYAEANLNQLRRVDDVARHMQMHPRYFGVLFKKETGISFPEWLTRVRMEKAREKLADLSSTTKELAQSLGYRNSSVFCQVFKRYHKVSPTEMRRRMLAEHSPSSGG